MKNTPDSYNEQNPSTPFWDNADQISKILYRLHSHSTLFLKAIRKNASLKRLLITRFPFRFKDSVYPPSLHIEFTDACNLKCVYCNNPHFSSPRKMMSDATFDNLIKHLSASKIDRICIGGGEPTLHPKFPEFVYRLASVSKIVTIVTNGHWQSSEITKAMLDSPIDFIEVSVESGSKSDFESTRIGSDFDLVIRNLLELKRLKRELKSKSHINLRLMVRPSQKGKIETDSRKFWKHYADTLMPQYVLQLDEFDAMPDVFLSKQMANNLFPKCGLPFRNIQVRSNGDVPICQISGSSLIREKKVIAGNVNDTPLIDIWRGELFKQYRLGHRTGNHDITPICKGCKGC